jgi:hypothetical protein
MCDSIQSRHQRFVAAEVQPAVRRSAPVASGGRASRDVEQAGKFGQHPIDNAILIADVVDSHLGGEGFEALRAAVVLDTVQRLSQVGLAPPDRDVQPPRIRPIGAGDDPARTVRVVPVADRVSATFRVARLDDVSLSRGFRKAIGVPREVFAHLTVGIDDLADELRLGSGVLQRFERRSRRDQAFDIQLVTVQHQPDHGPLIVRIATADVGQHDQPRPIRCRPHFLNRWFLGANCQ